MVAINDRISRYFKHEGGLMFEDKVKIPLGIVWRAALVMGITKQGEVLVRDNQNDEAR